MKMKLEMNGNTRVANNSIFDSPSLRFSKITVTWPASLEPEIRNSKQLLTFKSEIRSSFYWEFEKTWINIKNIRASPGVLLVFIKKVYGKYLTAWFPHPPISNPIFLAFHPNSSLSSKLGIVNAHSVPIPLWNLKRIKFESRWKE